MNITLIRIGSRTLINPSVGQPLGVMYIVSYLRKYRNNKDSIKIIDMKIHNYDIPTTIKKTLSSKPDIIGLSCFTPDAHLLHALSLALRNAGFTGKIIAGGPHPTADPKDALKTWDIDYAVIGEGENTFVELLNKIEKHECTDTLPGIAFRKNGEIKIIEKRDFIIDPDSIPFPAWDLIEFEEYFKYFSNAPLGKRRYMQIMTSRGCPYRCTYCHNIFGKTLRTRSVKNLLDEIKILYNRYNISEFEIMDDVFNFDIKRANEILDGIISLGLNLKFSFPNGLRGDRLPAELIQKMKRAGTYFAGIAIETASPRLQMLIKKNLKLDRVKESITNLKKAGIYTNGFLMFGFPTETTQEMKETFHFARGSDIDIAQVFVLNPFPGSEVYSQIFSQDGFMNKYPAYDYNVTPYNYSNVDKKGFSRILWVEYLRFYASKFRFLRAFLKYPRKRYFVHYIILILSRFILHFINKIKKLTTISKFTGYEAAEKGYETTKPL